MPEEAVDLTRMLVRFDTTNPPGNEEPAIRALGDYLARSGLQVEYQPVAENRANLIARLPGRGEEAHLVLSGHMDVVPAGETPWEYGPFAAALVDGRIYGRGSADMKGGVAAMAQALVNLHRGGFRPRADIILAVSSGEERHMPGARLMASSGVLAGSRYLVVGEPTGLDLLLWQKGARAWRITVRGRAAHSSTPDQGVNAIAFVAHFITALQHNTFSYEQHPHLGSPAVSVTMIEGGVAPNVIPERCSAVASIRTVPGQSDEDLDARLREVLATVRMETKLPVEVDIEVIGAIPPVETPQEDALAQAAIQALQDVLGHAPRLAPMTGGTEASILAPAYNLSFVILGPGELAQAHQVNESVDVREITAAVSVYEAVALRLLG